MRHLATCCIFANGAGPDLNREGNGFGDGGSYNDEGEGMGDGDVVGDGGGTSMAGVQWRYEEPMNTYL